MTDDVSTAAPKPVSLKSFLSDTVIYGLVGVTDKAIGLIVFPIMTYLLTVGSDYATMSLFGRTLNLLFIVFTVGLPTGFFRYYTESKDPVEQETVLSTALYMLVGFSAIWVILLFPFAGFLNQHLFNEPGVGLMTLLATMTFLGGLDSLGACRLQADGKAWQFVWINISNTFISRIGSISLVVLGYGVWGWALGEFIGKVWIVSLMAIFAFRGLAPRFSSDLAWKMFVFGGSLAPASLSQWLMTAADAYMLKFLAPSVEVGNTQVSLYSVGERISSIMLLVNMAFILGWRRFAYKNMHHDGDGPRLIAHGLTLILLASGYVALGLSMLGDDLIHWVVNPDFEAGVIVIPTLTVASLFSGMAEVVPIGLYKTNRTGLLSSLNIAAALANVALNFVMIPRYGMLGSAVATLICQVGKTALVCWYSQKAYPFPFEYGRLFLSCAVFTLTFFLGELIRPESWPARTAIHVILVAICPLVLWILGFFQEQEKQLVYKGIAQARRYLPGGSRG